MTQFLADILQTPIERPAVMETTALGAAYLAGLKAGIYRDTAEISNQWRCEARFEPQMPDSERTSLVEGWRRAVRQTLAE